MKHFEAGLCSVTFRPLSPDEILSLAREAGLSAIEWGSDVHVLPDSLSAAGEIGRKTRDAGLRVSSYGTYFTIGKGTEQELLALIRTARALGTDILRVWAGRCGSGSYDARGAERFFDDCRRVAAIAENEGVTVCTERHVGTYTDTKESALAMLDAVSSPQFRTYYQPDQFSPEEESEALAIALSDWTVHIHAFQWRGGNRYPLARGKEAWKRLLSYFPGNTVLLEFMPDDRPESLMTEAQTLKEILEAVQ